MMAMGREKQQTTAEERSVARGSTHDLWEHPGAEKTRGAGTLMGGGGGGGGGGTPPGRWPRYGHIDSA